MPKFSPPHESILDALPVEGHNLYCELSSLTNEAAVESFFISRLLKDFEWKDKNIRTKASIESLKVGQGSKSKHYKPDYALVAKSKVRCIIEAKGPDENLDDWIEQCSSYCTILNRRYDDNPVHYFLLTNGHTTQLYAWDRDAPLLSLSFDDFHPNNKGYLSLRKLLNPSAIVAPLGLVKTASPEQITFIRPTSEKARQLFAICHKVIWKSEVCSPSAAFLEFMKIMFVKMYEDRNLRYGDATKHYFAADTGVTTLPKTTLRFSDKWIQQREAEGDANPVDTILFGNLRKALEKEIKDEHKKRVFNDNEKINLRPDTIKDVVRRLEYYDMFGIDEDLNGRLFETFLNATMRGRELGQFFTPRSVVNMVTFLADLQATAKHQDRVMDACCGSGGFLIEAFTVMRQQIRDNNSLSEQQKATLINNVANKCIYGIDLGKDPPLARIARANMYLHGDGGSHIYYADGLDKDVKSFAGDDLELDGNLSELRTLLTKSDGFDVVLTNPPFAMAKEWKNPSERRILEQYKLARRDDTSAASRPSLRSSVMYMERYHGMLKPDGKLLTVIDDTLLSSTQFGYVRDYIRDHFIICAIISLPGDTFQRSGSRVKCSVLYLKKKQSMDETQPSCFAYFAEHIGIDDLTPRASDTDIQEARARANAEIDTITSSYKAFEKGLPAEIILTPDRLSDRLDLKFCVPLFGRMAPKWKAQGIEVCKLSECVTLVEEVINPADHPTKEFTLLRVSYDGRCEVDKVTTGARIKAGKMYRVHGGQLLFSTIRATDGAIGIVPPDMDGALVSGSYSVFDCATSEETAYVWSVLRSHEIRADMQSLSPGSGRYTTYWPDVGVVLLPWLAKDKRKAIGSAILHAWELERQMHTAHEAALSGIKALGVESDESIKRWQASKAPQ